jgi:hypothetical protein
VAAADESLDAGVAMEKAAKAKQKGPTGLCTLGRGRFIPGTGGQGCQIFLVHDTKIDKNVPNEQKMYQMVIKCPKCLLNIPNVHKIYQHFPI